MVAGLISRAFLFIVFMEIDMMFRARCAALEIVGAHKHTFTYIQLMIPPNIWIFSCPAPGYLEVDNNIGSSEEATVSCLGKG